ncbi:MAG: KGK domain-containing protein [Actinomycetota bacterium]
MKSKTVNLLSDEDVLSTGFSALMFQCTFKASEFLLMLQSRVSEEKLFTDGLECEILSPGTSWKKGRVKLRLEFCAESQEEIIDTHVVPNGSEEDASAKNSDDQLEATDDESVAAATNYATPNNMPPSKSQYDRPGGVGMWS